MSPLLAGLLWVASSSIAATPPEGVSLEVRRGVFTEADIGGFLTVGGQGGYSNLQSYLQLGVGYQLHAPGGSGLVPVGLHLGLGPNDQNCWAALNRSGRCSKPDSFSMLFIGLSGGYLFQLVDRLYLGPRVLAGVVLLDPVPVSGPAVRPTVGGMVSLEYATGLDHFSLGLDVAYRMVIGPWISSIAIFPRVQYTF